MFVNLTSEVFIRTEFRLDVKLLTNTYVLSYGR